MTSPPAGGLAYLRTGPASAQAGLFDRAADAALEGRTGPVIAHRLSRAAECDRIVVMDSGRIVEPGHTTRWLPRMEYPLDCGTRGLFPD